MRYDADIRCLEMSRELIIRHPIDEFNRFFDAEFPGKTRQACSVSALAYHHKFRIAHPLYYLRHRPYHHVQPTMRSV